jgi:hypothetical protein
MVAAIFFHLNTDLILEFDPYIVQTFLCMNISVCIGSGFVFTEKKNINMYISVVWFLLQSTAHQTIIHFELHIALISMALALILNCNSIA